MRQHIEHLLAALGFLVFAIFVSYFNTGSAVAVPPPELTSIPSERSLFASSTPPLELSTTTLDRLFNGAPVVATTTIPTPPAAPKPAVPVKKPETRPAPPPAPVASTTPEQFTSLKGAIVNILCVARDGSLRSISGSGVVVDSRGIVMTAAHVAQMFLLEAYRGTDKVSCTVRTGSPAKSMYLAHLIYIPESWIEDNSTTLISSQPTGTGEHDYALLAITSSVTGSSLPGSFPAIELSSRTSRVGDTAFLGTYGSQSLSSAQIRSALYPTFATSTVKDRLTFNENTVDVLSFAGSAASQEGSSGGAAVNEDSELIGLIATSQTSGAFSDRILRAITPSYISRSFETDTGKDFAQYFGNTSVTTLVNTYAPTVQKLGEFLAESIGLK
jgi:S1-C subfamily serine protease